MKKEGLYLEYKEAKKSLPKDFWESYSAFANTHGGLVVLGISDDLEIIGVENPQKIINDLFTNLNNQQKINYNVISDEMVKEREIDGKTVIEITIPEAPSTKKPVYLNQNIKQSYIRTFETDRKATEEEIKYFIRNSEPDLDSQLIDKFDIHDLDITSLSEYKILLSARETRFQDMSFEDMLIEIGAMKRDNDVRDKLVYKLTYGGLLFFGKYNSITNANGLHHFNVDYFNYINSSNRWKDRVAPNEANYQNMNIFIFYRTVLNKLIMSIEDEFKLNENLMRTSYAADIEIALREALANTLIHADYFYEDSIRIEAHNGYYTFHNPGNMRVSVSEFVKGGVPRPRNHTITTLFRKIGVCERAGSGGPNIFASAKNHKLNYPDIQTTNTNTTIKLWKVDIADAHPELNENESKVLKYLIKNMIPQSANQIKENLQLSKHFFDSTVKSLIEKGFIESIGKGRATKYTLKTDTAEYLANLQHMINMLQNYYVNK